MTRLVQLKNGATRCVALVEEPFLRVISGVSSVYELALAALAANTSLAAFAQENASNEMLDYDPIYNGASDWKLLPPIDHPTEPSRTLVTGTGLTHLGSAKDRQAMHLNQTQEETDSMRMFRWGVEGGRPESGAIGTAPEWFYKGTGGILRAQNEPLSLPSYGEDGGEEAEIAGVYIIGPDGQPHRIGMATGNEFSDHKFEKKNYLNLAGSKLRTCGLGPELVLNPEFKTVPGEVRIVRNGELLWSKEIATGEAEMCHSLQNIEHHHFKFEGHRNPGDIHVHYYGAHSLSFGAGVQLADVDMMHVRFDGFGRALINSLQVSQVTDALVTVSPL